MQFPKRLFEKRQLASSFASFLRPFVVYALDFSFKRSALPFVFVCIGPLFLDGWIGRELATEGVWVRFSAPRCPVDAADQNSIQFFLWEKLTTGRSVNGLEK
jgi:hypothetical protein